MCTYIAKLALLLSIIISYCVLLYLLKVKALGVNNTFSRLK